MMKKVLFKSLLFVLLALFFITILHNYRYQSQEESGSVSVLLTVAEQVPIEKPEISETSEKPELSREILSFKRNGFYYYTTFEVNGKKYYPGEMTQEEQMHAYNMSLKYGLEYEMVLALIGAESRWHRNSVSSSGCIGYGQILYRIHEKTLKNKGLDVYNSLDNIEYTCFLLASKMSVYGDYNKALMAYRYGNEGANSYFKKGIYESDYTRQIKAFRDGMLKVKGK